MNRKRRFGIRRFASSVAIALPVTVALLFLMTRLILPSENDRMVTRMIQNIEFHRAVRPPEPAGSLILQPPPSPAPPPTQPNLSVEGLQAIESKDTLADEGSETQGRAHVIDWWAEAGRLIQKSDEEALKLWLLEQGYERYASIMQGPLPITNSVHATLPLTQEDATGYMNSFGDMEYKISDNCVATTQVAARLDHSDFVKALPMRITCKAALKQVFSFNRYARD